MLWRDRLELTLAAVGTLTTVALVFLDVSGTLRAITGVPVWLVPLVVITLTACVVGWSIRTSSAFRRLHFAAVEGRSDPCPFCAYDMRHLADGQTVDDETTTVCPECGETSDRRLRRAHWMVNGPLRWRDSCPFARLMWIRVFTAMAAFGAIGVAWFIIAQRRIARIVSARSGNPDDILPGFEVALTAAGICLAWVLAEAVLWRRHRRTAARGAPGACPRCVRAEDDRKYLERWRSAKTTGGGVTTP